MAVIEHFSDNEQQFMDWIQTHEKVGYVLNVVKSEERPYKLHRASCPVFWREGRTTKNFTTARYEKACSTDRVTLSEWGDPLAHKHGRVIGECGLCFK
jgi:hypothetical protein